MSNRLKALYEEMILEHNKNPRNFREMKPCSHHAHGANPLCGDDYNIYITMENGKISDISFHGDGCAISKSSGSLMTSTVKGLDKDEALKIKDNFLDMLIKDDEHAISSIGRLKVFEGVKRFPIRVKCATLVWRALESALEKEGEEISTE